MLIYETHRLPPRTLQAAFGVTRIARITGLDRTGVEVCSAIRPGGHILQVSNGKGRTLAKAAAAALSEAAELWAAEHVRTHELKYGSRKDLTAAGLHCVWPDPDMSAEADELFIGWSRAVLLGSRKEAWVPAHVVHCPPAGVFLGPRIFRWTTNGLAAHVSRGKAILHALREVIERHQLAEAFPDGWTRTAVERLVEPTGTLRALKARIERGGFSLKLFDARTAAVNGLKVSVAAALLFDKDEGPIPLTAGYGCAASFETAAEAAMLEAAQSRLTDIHGAREDVKKDESGAASTLWRWFEEGRARPPPRSTGPRTVESELKLLTAELRRRGFKEVAVVELARAPLHIVRVVVPGLDVSELL